MLKQAIWQAQLRCLNAPPELMKAVLCSRVTEELGDHALWMRLVAKFAAGDAGRARWFALAVEALALVRTRRGAAQVKTLLRLPLRELLRHCMRLVGELLHADGHSLTQAQAAVAAGRDALNQLAATRWKPLLGKEPFVSRCGGSHGRVTWQVVELCSLEELKHEGSVMKHCVGSYARRCRRGRSAIFSVRRCEVNKDKAEAVHSHATIEVWPEKRWIWQVRSYNNCPVNNTVMNLVREWAAVHGLHWRA